MSRLTVRMGKRGAMTIPAKLREKYKIQEGDIFAVLDLGGVFVLSPGASEVEKIAREIERLLAEEGVSLQDLLSGLRDERDRYHEERYSQEQGD